MPFALFDFPSFLLKTNEKSIYEHEDFDERMMLNIELYLSTTKIDDFSQVYHEHIFSSDVSR